MAKILLVEDDNNLREIYEARLQAEGYQIVSANDGESALVVAKNEKPDLVISDVMMPKISGFEMLDILRNTDGLKDVKVIMLTALGQADDQARANKLGADRYLVKSQVTLEDIVRVSHELLEGAAPAAASPAPSEPVSTEPASQPSAAPQAEPAADVPAMPVATPPADAPTVTPSEPVTATPDAAQTSAAEEETVKQQIEEFVANQPATPPATVEPTPTVEAPTTPEVTTPETSTPPSAPTANETADSQVLSDAVDTLVADAESEAKQADTPAPEPDAPSAPAVPAVPPAEEVEEAETADEPVNGSVNIAHKKIIQPLNSSPQKSLDELVAQEEAGATNSSAAEATPIVGGADEAPAGAPTPPPSTQAETVGPDKPVDPNSIAL